MDSRRCSFENELEKQEMRAKITQFDRLTDQYWIFCVVWVPKFIWRLFIFSFEAKKSGNNQFNDKNSKKKPWYLLSVWFIWNDLIHIPSYFQIWLIKKNISQLKSHDALLLMRIMSKAAIFNFY